MATTVFSCSGLQGSMPCLSCRDGIFRAIDGVPRRAAVTLEDDGPGSVKDLTEHLHAEDLAVLFAGAAYGVLDHRAQAADVPDQYVIHISCSS